MHRDAYAEFASDRASTYNTRRRLGHCAGAIDPIQLQREMLSPQERKNQNYLGQDTRSSTPP